MSSVTWLDRRKGRGVIGAAHRHARRHPVTTYVLLAYALSWAYWIPMALTGQIVRPGGGVTHFPGLLGPLLAAVAATALLEGKAGLRRLLVAMGRWRIGWGWWAVALASPLLVMAAAIAALALAGAGVPSWADLMRFSGLPVMNVLTIFAVVLLVNGFGEETGWRGFALPRLQERHGALTGTLVLAVLWAGWHLPLFAILESFRGFSAVELPGFLLGITAGAFVLTWLFNRTGGSILAVAVWHASYNMTSATIAGRGAIAAATSTAVMIWAVVVVIATRRAHRAGRPPGILSLDPGRAGPPGEASSVRHPVRERPLDQGPASGGRPVGGVDS